MNKIYEKIFAWMGVGLLVTFLTGYFISKNDNLLYNIFGNNFYWIFVIVQIIVVIFLAARIHKMQPMTATICFFLYSFLTGITFSSIFVVYKLESILFVFLVTLILFIVFALIGRYTNLDLTKIGTFLFMGLIGILICGVINFFLKNTIFDLVITCVSLILFLGYTAYDIQKIKKTSYEIEDEHKLSILGALELYLDFINIFLDLLSIIGDNN